MSQDTIIIDCAQTGSELVSDINKALATLNSSNSGATAPTNDVVDGKLWLDTSGGNKILMVYLDGSWNQVVDLSGSIAFAIALG